jgi:hypothetical protein
MVAKSLIAPLVALSSAKASAAAAHALMVTRTYRIPLTPTLLSLPAAVFADGQGF